MSSYRHLIVCAILFFVLFYGSANFAKAESIPTNCDYEHVAMLFGAREQEFVMYNALDLLPPIHYVRYQYSIYGLLYDPVYNLVENPSHPTLKSEVIDMRDVVKAIINYRQQCLESLLPNVKQDSIGGSGGRVLTHPEHDANGNGIKDDLEVAIAYAIASGRGDQCVKVFSQFSVAPTDDDVAIFKEYGGIVTSQLFTRGPRFFGFFGEVPYNRIVDYAAANIRIGFIEEYQRTIEVYISPMLP